ncbi:MAG TPA: sigma-70 family RNA polymerase sigma factor [Phycisphaerae bacterium]|nr:sigma-70 family RNA polymerase sigma factor [Phycisphaerales bacterium]HRX87473.1 sigma-70 family RNA polymerase sigma factor [Phycisphaerae bacterium]
MGARFAAVLGAEVEDVVHHAFLALFRNREHISPQDDGLYRYLIVAARNAALDRIKTERLRSQRRGDAPPPTVEDTSGVGELLVREKTQAIRDFLGELDELDRFIVWSHVVDGKSIHAVARELGIGWHRASTRLQRILGALRRLLMD